MSSVHILEMNGESYRLKQSKRKRGHHRTPGSANRPSQTPPHPVAVNPPRGEGVFRFGLNAPPFRRRRPSLQTPLPDNLGPSTHIAGLLFLRPSSLVLPRP